LAAKSNNLPAGRQESAGVKKLARFYLATVCALIDGAQTSFYPRPRTTCLPAGWQPCCMVEFRASLCGARTMRVQLEN